MYILIVYRTVSPVFTSSGVFVCVFVTVFIVPFFKFVIVSAVTSGSLLVVTATLFIFVMNFLNAKSNSDKLKFTCTLNVFVSGSTIATGCSLVILLFTVQYVIVFCFTLEVILNVAPSTLAVDGILK